MRSLAALALLLAAFAAPPAFAQGGGVSAPRSGGVPAPDPAPEPQTPPAPDAAPGAGSDSVEPAPSPPTSPTPATPPDTTGNAPEASAPAPAAPRTDRRRGTSDERAAQSRARAKRRGQQDDRRSSAGSIRPASVFRASLASVGWTGRDTDSESPPVELIALALLTLVVASAALLRLTMRLSQIEGLTPAKRATSRSATR